jgi:hypothetical protein
MFGLHVAAAPLGAMVSQGSRLTLCWEQWAVGWGRTDVAARRRLSFPKLS